MSDQRASLRASVQGVLVGTLALATVTCAPVEDTTSLSQASTPAHGATTEGVDVSTYQGSSIDWNMVHASGRAFGIARTNDGISSMDPTFAVNWAGMRAAGMIRGAYQFFRPNDDALTQANIVCTAVGTLGAGDLPATLDLEVSGGQTPSQIIADITTWLTRVEACTGKRPMIYTAGWFWNPSVGSTAFSSYPLWVSAYGPMWPTLPMGWTDWAIYQYSDGTVPAGEPVVPGIGQDCDRNMYNGSLAELQTFTGMPGSTTPVYGATFVAQSFPYTSVGTLQVHQGETIPSYIEMRNSGTAPWNSSTRLATTAPRDRASSFVASDWAAPNRLAAVTGTVAPGASFRFMFGIHAPIGLAPGMYDEHFGIVQEGTGWFSDPGELGPPDSQLEGIVEVLPALPSDGGVTDAGVATDTGVPTDTGVATDAGTTPDAPATDAGSSDARATDAGHPTDARTTGDANGDGGAGGTSATGCNCTTVPTHANGARGFTIAGVLAVFATRTRRRRSTRR